MEGDSNCSLAEVVGYGEVSLFVAEEVNHERLEVHGRKVVADLDIVIVHFFEDEVSLSLGEGVV